MVEIHIKISLKKKKQIIKRYGNNTHKISLKKTNNKRNNRWKNGKKLFQQCVEKNKIKRWAKNC